MPLTPMAALEKSLNKEIIVALKDGTLLKGHFESYDVHMNIRLRDASLIDREEKEIMKFKNVVIRGSRLLRVHVVL